MFYASDYKTIYKPKVLDNQWIEPIKEKPILNRKIDSADLIDRSFMNWLTNSFDLTSQLIPNW